MNKVVRECGSTKDHLEGSKGCMDMLKVMIYMYKIPKKQTQDVVLLKLKNTHRILVDTVNQGAILK